jgi:hypothetical protein
MSCPDCQRAEREISDVRALYAAQCQHIRHAENRYAELQERAKGQLELLARYMAAYPPPPKEDEHT